ncbi:MAG: transposase [Planctomycetia bacterium]|jgi:transposase-like protein
MKKRRSAEQIVGLLRQADVDFGKGANVPDVCRRLGISQQTYYRWRTKFAPNKPRAEDRGCRGCLAKRVPGAFLMAPPAAVRQC